MATVNDFIFKNSQDKYYLINSGSESLAKLLGYDLYIDSIKNSISSINSELDSLSNTINEIRVQFIGESDTVPSDQANVLFLKRNIKATEITYTNTIEELPNVTSIEMSPSNPKEGDTVSITFYPDEQHGVDTSGARIRYYLQDGTEAWVTPTKNAIRNYLEFIQPAGNCYIYGIMVIVKLPGADEETPLKMTIIANVIDPYTTKIGTFTLGQVNNGESFSYKVDDLRKEGFFGEGFKRYFICKPLVISGIASIETEEDITSTFTITIGGDSDENGIMDVEEDGNHSGGGNIG